MTRTNIKSWGRFGVLMVDTDPGVSAEAVGFRTHLGENNGMYILLDRGNVQEVADILNDWLTPKWEMPKPPVPEPDVYWVQSDSDPGTNYKVTHQRGMIWDCTCVDHKIRGRWCKHITRAMRYRQGQPAVGDGVVIEQRKG